jgi:hypothetical protein
VACISMQATLAIALRTSRGKHLSDGLRSAFTGSTIGGCYYTGYSIDCDELMVACDWVGTIAVDAGVADVPYEESVEYAWTEKAFGMLESGGLRGEVVSRDGVIRSRVWGPCPRCQGCGHEIDDRQTLTAVANLMGREWRVARRGHGQDDGGEAGPVFVPVDVSCGCGKTHPGGPADSTGCGVSFRVELPVQQADAGGGG